MRVGRTMLFCIVACAVLAADEITVSLQGPLTTVVPVAGFQPQTVAAIRACITVPTDAPGDLGVGAFVADHDGTWYQLLQPEKLAPGVHDLVFPLPADGALLGEPHRGSWQQMAGTKAWKAGLIFWTTSTRPVSLHVAGLRTTPRKLGQGIHTTPRLLDLELTDIDTAGVCHAVTGERWDLSVRPEPFPSNPFDPGCFELLVEVTDPAGATHLVRGFYDEPRRLMDRGDREQASIIGHGRWRLRYRPQLPGRHRLRLRAVWNQGGQAYQEFLGPCRDTGRHLTMALPDLEVAGDPWDDYVRVDRLDRRFLRLGANAFFWPIGLNIRSVSDPRGTERTESRPTVDRGTFSYEAYLRRFAAAGGNTVEIWMSNWNLALEWREDWNGFHGVGRYNLDNATRLDVVLDQAYALGLRVNLVIDNHGKASDWCDEEWADNPYNAALDGPLSEAWQLFSRPEARMGQERLRRYIVARWADHPALLAWKLFTEINLTSARPPDAHRWVAEAGDRWRALDPYGHPITIHWSNDYLRTDRRIVVLPQLDFICIDAYHYRGEDRRGPGTYLSRLLWDSTNDDRMGLSHPEVWAGNADALKPVLVTEFGGDWNAAPRERLLAEHLSGPWTGLVSGHAGAPLLWWFEWVDQDNLWLPYRAIGRFMAGEDLRSRPDSPARPARLHASASTRQLWCAVWSRPGRILGYCLDRAWQYTGESDGPITGAVIMVSERDSLPGGRMQVAWWNADDGSVIARETIDHPGGRLRLTVPTFERHIAFKLWREDGPGTDEAAATSPDGAFTPPPSEGVDLDVQPWRTPSQGR